MIAVTNQDLGNDAAVGVSDPFDPAFEPDVSRRHHRAANRDHRSGQAEARNQPADHN